MGPGTFPRCMQGDLDILGQWCIQALVLSHAKKTSVCVEKHLVQMQCSHSHSMLSGCYRYWQGIHIQIVTKLVLTRIASDKGVANVVLNTGADGIVVDDIAPGIDPARIDAGVYTLVVDTGK